MNLYQLSNIISLIGIGVAIAVYLYDKYIRRYIRINVLRKTENMYHLIYSKRLGMKTQSFNFKQKTYVIGFDKSINDMRNRPIIYYELDNINPIYFVIGNESYKFNPTNLYRVLRSNAISKLLSAKVENIYTIIIIALIIGIVAISIFDNYRIGELNNQLIKFMNQTRPYY